MLFLDNSKCNVHAQVASLISIGFLSDSKVDNSIVCNLEYATVDEMAKYLNFPLIKYLHT